LSWELLPVLLLLLLLPSMLLLLGTTLSVSLSGS
jgi:hypothetical protein